MTTLKPAQKAARLPALDVFRGLTIFAMLMVNEMAGIKGVPAFFKHVAAAQDGMSFADVIFPAFLFITGMAIPASGKTLAYGQQLLLISQRSLALIVIGVFMVNAENAYALTSMPIAPSLWAIFSLLACYLVWGNFPAAKPAWLKLLRATGILSLISLALLYRDQNTVLTAMQSHWWGILGLIGWAYFISANIASLCRGKPLLLAFSAFSLPLLSSLIPESTLLALNGHLNHSAIMLFGALCFELLYGLRSNQQADSGVPPSKNFDLAFSTYLRVLLLAALLMLGARFSHQFFAYSKIAATPPWLLASSAYCCLAYVALAYSLQIWRWQLGLPRLMLAAQNALLCYILPYLIYPALQFSGLSYPWLSLNTSAACLLILSFVLALIWLAAELQKRKIRWQI